MRSKPLSDADVGGVFKSIMLLFLNGADQGGAGGEHGEAGARVWRGESPSGREGEKRGPKAPPN